MVAVFEIDPKTLIWVKEEIEKTLEESISTLEVYLEQPDEVARMEVIADSIHKIRGALEMLEIFGAVLLTQEMEAVAEALVADKIKLKDDAMDALMRGMLQLPAYLNQLYHGSKDIPLVLLPLLNDMRAVQEKALLTESAFFSPNLTALKPVEVDNDESPATWDMRTIAKKLRPVYLSGLLGFFRDEKVSKSLRMLATVITNLEQASTQKKTEQIWWVSAGLIQALYDKGLEPSVAIKLLLGKVDREIKRLIDEGEGELNNEPPHELMKNMLYYIGRSTSASTRVRELKLAFNLSASLPDSQAITEARDELIGFNANIMENIARQLNEELLTIKDTLDINVNLDGGKATQLQPVIERLKSVADALGMLGLSNLRKLIHKQEVFINDLIQQDKVLSHEDVLQVARILLYIESSLYDLNVHEKASEVIDDKDLNELSSLPEAEYRQVVNTTAQEALEDLNKVKDAVSEFSLNSSDPDIMADVPRRMELIKGAVKMLSHPRVVRVIEAISEYVEQEISGNRVAPDGPSFDFLANAITGVEYYLEGILQKSVTSDYAIELAEFSLANLGHAPQQIAVENIEQEETIDEAEDTTLEEVAPLVPAASSGVEEAEAEINLEVDEELFSIFLTEAGDELEEITSCLEKWKADRNDEESLTTLIRSFHTLKGAGRIVGATSIGMLAWSIEELLRRVEDERIQPGEEIIELLEATVPTLAQLVMQMKNGDDDLPLDDSSSNVHFLVNTARELREEKHAVG